MEKIEALAKYLEIPVESIKEISDSEFEIGDYENDRENWQEWRVYTDSEANDAVREDIENTLEDSGWIFNLNIEDYLDEDTFYDDMYNSNYDYATDIILENDDRYINRFIRECVERDIIDVEDCEENEDGLLEPDGDSEDYVDDFVDSMNEDYSNSIEWFIDSFGEEQISDLYSEGRIDIDIDSLTEDIISWDGRGNNLSSYDGDEIELDGGYFAYRQ